MVFSFTAPLVIYGLIYSATMQGKTIGLHEEYALSACIGNIAAVIAYAYGRPALLKGKKIGELLKIGKKRGQ